MKNVFKLALAALGISSFLIANTAFAHQPRINYTNSDPELILNTEVEDPLVSKAYYAELDGKFELYEFSLDEEKEFYFNILVPDIDGAKTDFSADLVKKTKEPETPEESRAILNEKNNLVARLDGINFEWTPFYEEFAGDDYLKGPEAKIKLEAGTYLIKVYSPENFGKYVLATGDIESFPIEEIIRTVRTLPGLKTDFFGKPAYTAFTNLVGVFLGVSLLVTVALVIFAYFVARKFLKKADGS